MKHPSSLALLFFCLECVEQQYEAAFWTDEHYAQVLDAVLPGTPKETEDDFLFKYSWVVVLRIVPDILHGESELRVAYRRSYSGEVEVSTVQPTGASVYYQILNLRQTDPEIDVFDVVARIELETRYYTSEECPAIGETLKQLESARVGTPPAGIVIHGTQFEVYSGWLGNALTMKYQAPRAAKRSEGDLLAWAMARKEEFARGQPPCSKAR